MRVKSVVAGQVGLGEAVALVAYFPTHRSEEVVGVEGEPVGGGSVQARRS